MLLKAFSAIQQLEQLNSWLQINGQFKEFGMNVPAFMTEVVATATAEAMPSPTTSPAQPVAPLPSPMVTLAP